MKTHENKMINERIDLAAKIEKLTDFLENPIGAPKSDLSLLRVQLATMGAYLAILSLRINNI